MKEKEIFIKSYKLLFELAAEAFSPYFLDTKRNMRRCFFCDALDNIDHKNDCFFIKAQKLICIKIENDLKKEEREKPVRKTDLLMEFWNNLENVTHHRNETKTYKRCVVKLQALLNGTFISKYPLDIEFIKKLVINVKYLRNYKFSMDEIKEILTRLSLLCSPGYSFNKYDYTPKSKSLDNLLYNSQCNSSYFFLVLAKCPRLCKQNSIDLNKLPFPTNYLKLFTDIINYEYRQNETDIKEIALGIQKVIDFHKKYKFKNESLQDPEYFLYTLKNYLKMQFKDIKPYMIGNKSFIWKGFCNFIKQQYFEDIK